jgi:hypothetical protein
MVWHILLLDRQCLPIYLEVGNTNQNLYIFTTQMLARGTKKGTFLGEKRKMKAI